MDASSNPGELEKYADFSENNPGFIRLHERQVEWVRALRPASHPLRILCPVHLEYRQCVRGLFALSCCKDHVTKLSTRARERLRTVPAALRLRYPGRHINVGWTPVDRRMLPPPTLTLRAISTRPTLARGLLGLGCALDRTSLDLNQYKAVSVNPHPQSSCVTELVIVCAQRSNTDVVRRSIILRNEHLNDPTVT